jgi:hypothetical protein
MCDLWEQLEPDKLSITETRATKLRSHAKSGGRRGGLSSHVKRKASLSSKQGRGGPIRMVLRRLAAQVCMNGMQ